MTRMTVIRRADVVTDPIVVGDVETLVADPSAGAVVSFSGDVRNHDHGRTVATLTYEGHPTASDIIADVAREVSERHNVIAIAVIHRVGPIKIGESALVVAVASAHRKEAFAACADLVDTTKDRLPVWKHQVFTDGTDEWVNCA